MSSAYKVTKLRTAGCISPSDQMLLSAKHVVMQIRKITSSLIECTLSARRDSILIPAPLESLEERTSA